jgi:type II secretory pathway component PulF
VSQGDLVPLSAVVQQLRLVDFVSRLLLALNLLLASYFCYVVYWVVPRYREIFPLMRPELPGATEALFSVSPTAIYGSIAGLVAGLIILEVAARSRKTKIICNTVAIALLVSTILFVDTAIGMAWFAMTNVI